MFLSSFERLRQTLLNNYHIDSLLHLGPRTFDELSGEVVQNAAFVISKANTPTVSCRETNSSHVGNKQFPAGEQNVPTVGTSSPQGADSQSVGSELVVRNVRTDSGTYFRLVDGKNCGDKERMFLDAKANHTAKVYYSGVEQGNFEKIPGSQLGFWLKKSIISLFGNETFQDNSYTIVKGIFTGNNNYFLKLWFEVSTLSIGSEWKKYAKAGGRLRWYGLDSYIVRWHNDGKELKEFEGAGLGASKYYEKKHFVWSGLTTSAISFRLEPDLVWFDDVSPAVIFDSNTSDQDIKYMLGFGNSCISRYLLKLFNPTLHYQISDIKKLPLIKIETDKLTEISKIVGQNITYAKLDWDSHETSWDYEGNPLVALCNQYTQGGCGATSYRLENFVKDFEAEWKENFNQLHQNEEELNRQFIEIYGLQDELTPDVPKDEITILQQGEISIEDNRIVWHDDVIIKQFISWLVGCFMGRFSVDKPGLILASQGQTVEDLNLPAHTIEIDDDGIIPVIMEEDFFTDDLTQRIESAVRTLYGEKYFYDNLKFIKTAIGKDLRDYIYNDFYNEHLQLYFVKLNNANAKRPIYWLFSSQMGDKKKKGYFKALVYMHRLEADTLSKLHADYVHPYLQKIEQQLVEAEDNAMRDDLSSKQKKNAINLAETLRDKVREVKAFESQLVEMASARITIDLDDGVKVNYPKFYPLVEPIKGINKSNDD